MSEPTPTASTPQTAAASQLPPAAPHLPTARRQATDEVARMFAHIPEVTRAGPVTRDAMHIQRVMQAIPPVPTVRPLDAYQRRDAQVWFARLGPEWQRLMIGDGPYERYRRGDQEGTRFAIEKAYLDRVIQRYRTWWAAQPESLRRDYRKHFGKLGYVEDQLAQMAFNDAHRKPTPVESSSLRLPDAPRR